MIPNQYYYNPVTSPSTPQISVKPLSPSSITPTFTPRHAQFMLPTYTPGTVEFVPNHNHQKNFQRNFNYLNSVPNTIFSVNSPYGRHYLPSVKSSVGPFTPCNSQQQYYQTQPYIDKPPILNNQHGRIASRIPVTIPKDFSEGIYRNFIATSPSQSFKGRYFIPETSHQTQSYINQSSPVYPFYRTYSTGESAPITYEYPLQIDNSYKGNQTRTSNRIYSQSQTLSSEQLATILPIQSKFIHHQKPISLPSLKVYSMNSGASMNMAGSPTQRPGTLRKSSIKGKAPLGRIDQPVNKPVHSNANSQFKRERESRAINKGNPQYIGHSTGSSPNTRTIISESSIHYPIHKLSIDLPEELSTELKTDIYSQIKIRKYSASAIDLTRSYLTVYEYQVDDHWVIWDYETGFVHLTGIWKAALVALNANGRNAFGTSSSNTKADIAKLLESCPRKYHPYIKRKRGGFLKIQGTWMPYNLCRFLAKKFCYYIRYKLIPIFGEDFPSYCLAPTDRGFGQLKLPPGELEDANIELPALPDEVMDETSKAVISKDNGRKRKLPSDAPIRNVRRNKSDTDLLPVRSEITVKQEKDNVFGSSKRPFRPLPQPSKSNNSKNMVAEQELMESPIIISKEGKKDDDKESKDLLLKHISPECNNADLTYSELVDIVNASRCLQLLSKTSPSNDYKAQSSKSDLYNDENDDGKNYTITSQYNKSGISTILFAAGLSREEDSLDNEVLEIEDIRNSLYSDLNLSASPSDNRRSSMKIDDLLS